MEEKAKAAFWKPALIYGAIVGFVGILFGVIFYIMGLSTKNWSQWISSLIALAVLIYCLVAYRKEYLGGFASFGQIFLMALVIGIVATILSTIYSYILMGVIDPELIDKLKLVAEEKITSNPRIPENYYDIAMERLDKQFTLNRMLVMGAIMGPIMYAIIGLIAAAFIKKEETPADMVV
jgi:cation transport ATPase